MEKEFQVAFKYSTFFRSVADKNYRSFYILMPYEGVAMTDPEEILRQRLMYQSKRRGTKEADMIIGQFAIENIHSMTPEELRQFGSLLEESDPDLMSWISGIKTPPDYHKNDIFKRICNFKNILLNH
ncbi:MAG: hypothetical protein CMM83_03090 [Rhodospirillales bacterium]|nr:hypothetical protein [Rhodospirillales bacterium]|tara:strand:+ start:12334 stop:12714 length:381 start_codon:yes stop_codon:yes gene_type:complete